MSAVREFAAAFCIGCVALGVLYILVPDGNISNAVKYAFTLVFLCMILGAAVKISSFKISGFSAGARDFGDERVSAAAAQMIFAEALSGENINFSKITVFTDKTESGGINITKVYVYTPETPEKIISVIGSDIYEVVVINEQDN